MTDSQPPTDPISGQIDELRSEVRASLDHIDRSVSGAEARLRNALGSGLVEVVEELARRLSAVGLRMVVAIAIVQVCLIVVTLLVFGAKA